jgi:vacuolar protein sorting-associated protein 53
MTTLNLQGLRRQDQANLLELYRVRMQKIQLASTDPFAEDSAQFELSGESASKPNPLSILTSPEHESSRIKKLEKLIKKRM